MEGVGWRKEGSGSKGGWDVRGAQHPYLERSIGEPLERGGLLHSVDRGVGDGSGAGLWHLELDLMCEREGDEERTCVRGRVVCVAKADRARNGMRPMNGLAFGPRTWLTSCEQQGLETPQVESWMEKQKSVFPSRAVEEAGWVRKSGESVGSFWQSICGQAAEAGGGGEGGVRWSGGGGEGLAGGGRGGGSQGIW